MPCDVYVHVCIHTTITHISTELYIYTYTYTYNIYMYIYIWAKSNMTENFHFGLWRHGFTSTWWPHYCEDLIGTKASQITSLTIVYSTVYSGTDQRKYHSSASLAFVRGIHRAPVNSPHKGPVTQQRFHLMTSSCCNKQPMKCINITGDSRHLDSYLWLKINHELFPRHDTDIT